METMSRGTRVLISDAAANHNGCTGTVVSDGQQSASLVAVDGCGMTHTYHNSNLRPVPEQDTTPAPC